MRSSPPLPDAPAGLYIHFPFCASHCSYCDFPTAIGRDSQIDTYLAALEAEIAQLDPTDQADFLAEIGESSSGIDRIALAAFDLLGLSVFFTSTGGREARAWPFPEGTTAASAAGMIHTDFERGFVRAEVIGFDDYLALGGEQGARDAGKMRVEGRDHIIRDGDVIRFRYNL